MKIKTGWCWIVVAACLSAGCVEIRQEIRMNHDGSGTLVDRTAVTQRGLRLLAGMKKRTGKGAPIPAILTDEAVQERLKSMGEVTLESKKEVTLPDGRKQIETVFAFKDISKVNFWIAPTLAYKNKLQKERRLNCRGLMKLQYTADYVRFSRRHREQIAVNSDTTHALPPQEASSPANRERFRRTLPIFLDLLKDFHASIVLIAPIEDFEEKEMLWGLPVTRNRVTMFELNGKGVIHSSDMIQQLSMNEVYGGGDFARHQEAMAGVFTPWPAKHGGYGMRFMKSTPAPQDK